MIPTRRGLFFIGVALVIYLLAQESNVGWFYVADAVVWAILLVNLALPRWTLGGLRVKRRVALDQGAAREGIFQGDTVRVVLEITNPGRVPRYFFTMADPCPLEAPGSEMKRLLVGYVAPHSSVLGSYSVVCYRRGEYQFGPIRVECSAPFGMFRSRRKVKAPLRVLVYPQVFDFAIASPQGELLEGVTVPTPTQRSGDVRGSREYQPGDSLRQVHWRSSARHGQLMVKEYDRGPESQVALFFSTGQSFGTGRETTLEYSIKLAASIAKAHFRGGTSFRMAPPGAGLPFPEWRALLEYLARLEEGQGPSPTQGLASLAGVGQVLAIVSAADVEAWEAVSRLPVGRLASVVVLRGFDPQAESAGALAAFKGIGVPVVTCTPGGMQKALDELAGVGAQGSRQLASILRSRAVNPAQPDIGVER